MNTFPNRLRCFVAAALLLTAGLATACNTGTEAGDANVEQSDEKVTGMRGGDGPDEARQMRDTATTKAEKDYENTRSREDSNNNGIAD